MTKRFTSHDIRVILRNVNPLGVKVDVGSWVDNGVMLRIWNHGDWKYDAVCATIKKVCSGIDVNYVKSDIDSITVHVGY